MCVGFDDGDALLVGSALFDRVSLMAPDPGPWNIVFCVEKAPSWNIVFFFGVLKKEKKEYGQ